MKLMLLCRALWVTRYTEGLHWR